jgi:hypothetical protein
MIIWPILWALAICLALLAVAAAVVGFNDRHHRGAR